MLATLPKMLIHLAFLGLIGTVALIRWRLLGGTTYPTGLDGGNWLAYGHAIFGEHLRSSTLLYPPVVPVAAAVSERLLGAYGGLLMLAFVSAAAPAVGAYVLLYGWGLGWRAPILAALLAASAGTGEAMAWGGYPQLIGLGILPIFIFALDRFLTSRRLLTAVPPAILVAAALATNELIGPLTVLIGLLYLIARYTFLSTNGTRNSIRNVILGIGLTVILALPLAPLYLGLTAGILSNERLKAGATSPIVGALGGLGAAIKDLPVFWMAALALACLSPLILAVSRERLALLSSSVLLPSLAILFATGENRLAYVLPLGIVFGLAAWWALVDRLSAWVRQSFGAVVVTCLAIDILIGTQYFATQRDYYEVLTPSVAQGLTVLESRSTKDQVIAVSAVGHEWELGWWVEGVVHRRTIYAGSPLWLTYSDEKARNALANRIFAPGNSPTDSARLARNAGAAYIFVDKDWSGYTDWIGGRQNLDLRMLTYENQSVMILDTGLGTT